MGTSLNRHPPRLHVVTRTTLKEGPHSGSRTRAHSPTGGRGAAPLRRTGRAPLWPPKASRAQGEGLPVAGPPRTRSAVAAELEAAGRNDSSAPDRCSPNGSGPRVHHPTRAPPTTRGSCQRHGRSWRLRSPSLNTAPAARGSDPDQEAEWDGGARPLLGSQSSLPSSSRAAAARRQHAGSH